MSRISLKKILSERKVSELVKKIISAMDSPVIIQDKDGMILVDGSIGDVTISEYPVMNSEDVIGWIRGSKSASSIALLLTHLAETESVKKELVRELLAKYKELALLYNIAERITISPEIKEVAKLVIEEAKSSIKATSASVMLFNKQRGCLEVVASFGKDLQPEMSIKPGEGITGAIFLSGRAEIVNDVLSDKRYIAGQNRISSMICAPLKVEDRVAGVTSIGSETPANYTAGDLKLFTSLSSQIAVVLENARLHEQAGQDTLTGLDNRRGFEQKIGPLIAKARQHGFSLTLACMDLDRFKQINDSLGHAAGDEALRRVAHVMTSMVRSSDILARMGGDEFILVLPDASLTESQKLVDRLRRAIEQLDIVSPDDPTVDNLGISIGLVQWHEDMTLEKWLLQADEALYQNKAINRSGGCAKSESRE